ncbi:hypothetical protein WN55_06253 [Dufourea novaeangliae]|uniref:Uncharacterized protein n=1 Tax=Dufourea novaeangliae TaxID=178035 RepID=A0A154PPS3_DUFNO|nr:hypothetical protein WN55_06253 [Dufourea novaeangliae]
MGRQGQRPYANKRLRSKAKRQQPSWEGFLGIGNPPRKELQADLAAIPTEHIPAKAGPAQQGKAGPPSKRDSTPPSPAVLGKGGEKEKGLNEKAATGRVSQDGRSRGFFHFGMMEKCPDGPDISYACFNRSENSGSPQNHTLLPPRGAVWDPVWRFDSGQDTKEKDGVELQDLPNPDGGSHWAHHRWDRQASEERGSDEIPISRAYTGTPSLGRMKSITLRDIGPTSRAIVVFRKAIRKDEATDVQYGTTETGLALTGTCRPGQRRGTTKGEGWRERRGVIVAWRGPAAEAGGREQSGRAGPLDPLKNESPTEVQGRPEPTDGRKTGVCGYPTFRDRDGSGQVGRKSPRKYHSGAEDVTGSEYVTGSTLVGIPAALTRLVPTRLEFRESRDFGYPHIPAEKPSLTCVKTRRGEFWFRKWKLCQIEIYGV